MGAFFILKATILFYLVAVLHSQQHGSTRSLSVVTSLTRSPAPRSYTQMHTHTHTLQCSFWHIFFYLTFPFDSLNNKNNWRGALSILTIEQQESCLSAWQDAFNPFGEHHSSPFNLPLCLILEFTIFYFSPSIAFLTIVSWYNRGGERLYYPFS